jgi:hypothetical protein
MIRVRVPVHHIDFVCRLVESYGDLAIVRTENGTSDILQMWIPRGMVEDAQSFVGWLGREGFGEYLEGPRLMGPSLPWDASW